MSEPTAREFDALTQSMRDLTKELQQLPEKLRTENEKTYVRKDVLEPTLEGMKGAIDRHDNWLTWAQRLVLGAVGLAVLGLVLVSTGAVRA
jgi:hypothetical protein